MLWVLQLTVLSKSWLREEIDDSLVLIEGVLGKTVEECKVEPSAYLVVKISQIC